MPNRWYVWEEKMRTKQEVINFLESKVGQKIPCPGNSSLDGMCVTLIKSLMEFLGVPDPYKARGHAKTVISAYLSEGIAKPGLGFISVFSNKDMGSGYGHIWCNAGDGDGTFYESNGAKPLTVTKGKTYSYDAVCNFDSYIKDDTYRGYDLSNTDSMKICVDDHIKVAEGQLVDKAQYEAIKSTLTETQKQNTILSGELGTANSQIKTLLDKTESQAGIIKDLNDKDVAELKTLKEADERATNAENIAWEVIRLIGDDLKVSTANLSLEDAISAVKTQYTAFSSSSNLANDKIKSLEDEIKRLNTYKRPIAKISTKDLILYLLKKLIGKV